MQNYTKRPKGRHLTMQEESMIRGEINKGVPHDEICERWGIGIPRLRKVNCGPLHRKGYALEAYLK